MVQMAVQKCGRNGDFMSYEEIRHYVSTLCKCMYVC